jgi:hypothetical protein
MAALRGAATLKARLQKGFGATTIPPIEEKCGEAKETNILTALDYVFRGGVLLKRTRKGMSTEMFATMILPRLNNKRRMENA